MTSSSSGNPPDIYIYELPHSVRQELCDHLDSLNVWSQLSTFMSLRPSDIQLIKNQQARGKSPTNEILNIWGGQYNHTVFELFVLLYKQKLFQAMRLLKNFTERRYHTLIPNSVPDISDLVKPVANVQSNNNTERKLLNISNATSSGVSNSNNTDNSDANSTNDSRAEQDSNNLSKEVRAAASFILEINYNELCEATNNWSDINILGRGGFGIVYRGYWKHTDVAIKLMNYRRPNGDENVKVQIQQSLNELKHLNSCRHDNVLPLYGYSIKGEKPCLVYQLMKGGSLEERIARKKYEPLNLEQRCKICLGTARGINFLHTSRAMPLIHGDIKPGNILLDECLQPKIGDFGLAREGPKPINSAVKVTQVFGTRVYLPPEFINSRNLSTQVDTYSFGVVLMETFTGKRAYDTKRTIPLRTYILQYCSNPENQIDKLFDPRIPPPIAGAELDMCLNMLRLAMTCTADTPQHRPEMEQVLKDIDNYCNRILYK